MQASDLRVVIVEDEIDSALIMQTALELRGAQVWAVSTAEEAFSLIKEVHANLILVDLALPGLDGWGFMKQFRMDPTVAAIPVIVISAYISHSVAEKALAAGFKGCISKPIDINTLVESLLALRG